MGASATRKIFVRIPPNASPQEVRRIAEEVARRLQTEVNKNPEVLKPR